MKLTVDASMVITLHRDGYLVERAVGIALELDDLDPAAESPPYRRLVGSLVGLNNEERIDLLALGWFGAGLFPNWRQSLEHAEKMVARFDPHYTAGYGRHWRAGYKRVTGG